MIITDPLFYILAVPTVLLSGISKTGVPGLFGGMAVPLLSLAVSPAQAAAIMLPVLCAIDLFGLRAVRGVFDPANMPMLVVGLVVGIAAGTLTFGLIPEDLLRLLVGLLALTLALNNLTGWARKRPPRSASWPRGVFWGALGGFTSFVMHSGDAPLMAYLLPQRLDTRIYVGTTIWYFFLANYAKIVPYAFLGQLNTQSLVTALVLLPLVPAGTRLGLIVQGRLNEAAFYRISYWALLPIGVKLVFDGITG